MNQSAKPFPSLLKGNSEQLWREYLKRGKGQTEPAGFFSST